MFAKRFVFVLLILSLFLSGCGEAKPKTYTVGVIMELAWLAPAYDGFKTSMTELGYVEGQNITYLYSEEVTGGDQAAFDAEAKRLVEQNVDLIFTIGTLPTKAAKTAVEGTNIPVVFDPVINPVEEGVVQSISSPGGNVTGIQVVNRADKALEWALKVIPGTKYVYIPYNPDDQFIVMIMQSLFDGVPQQGVELLPASAVTTPEQMAAAVETYRRLVGRPPSDLQAPPAATGLPMDMESALSTAVDNSPVLISAQADTRLADANVDAAAAQGRLSVTAEAGFSQGADFDDNLSESSNDSVGVRVSVPLFQGGLIRSRTRQQRALRSASNLDLAAAERSVQESVTNAWTGLASARSAVQSAQEQVDAAELAYEGVRLEQETGLRSTVEVLDQVADLLTAQIALAQAERDLVVAERRMLAAVGTLDIPAASGGLIENNNDQLRGR